MLSSFRAIAPLRLASTRSLTRCLARPPASPAARSPLASLSLRNSTPVYRSFVTTRRFAQEAVQSGSQFKDDFLPTELQDAPTAPKRSLSGMPTKFAQLADLGVHQTLVDTITKKLKYEDMTEVQSKTIPACNSGIDVIARAKTGTGKTIAFLVPTINRLLQQGVGSEPDARQVIGRIRSSADVRVVIISPTRELAMQIAKDAVVLTAGTGIRCSTMVGGTGKREALSEFHRRGCHILIGTPGRLADIMSDPECGVVCKNVQTLIYDEADSLMAGGFEKETREIKSFLPNERQTLMFSATMPDKVRSLISETMKPDHKFINTVDPKEAETHTKVPQHIIMVDSYENQIPTLLELLCRENDKARAAGEPFKAIVFFGTARGTEVIAMMFRRLRHSAYQGHPLFPLDLIQIHSRLTQSRRTQAANAFKLAENAVLFSSDVTARGMDFPNVTHVIQMGNPTNREQYIHRLGRTARGANVDSGKSTGYLITSPVEAEHVVRELRGIKLLEDTNEDLLSPKANLRDLDSLDEKTAEWAKSVLNAFGTMDKNHIHQAWSSSLGALLATGSDPLSVVEGLWRMTKYNAGLDDPPFLSYRLAQQMAIPHALAIKKGYVASERPEGDNSFGSGFKDGPPGSVRSMGDRNRNNYPDRPAYSPRSRPSRGTGFDGNDRDSSFGNQGRSSYRDREGGNSFGDRPRRSSYGNREGGSSYGDRAGRSSYGDREGRSSYGSREGKSSFGGRDGKSSYGKSYAKPGAQPWEGRGSQKRKFA